MKALIVPLALVLSVPAAAQDKKGKDTDEKPAAAQAKTPDAVVQEAEQKAAAGDLDGAVELLRRAAGMSGASGEVFLRLGRMLQERYDFDGAIDALKLAAEKLTGPGKGEALGRTAVAQEIRGMPDAAASAQAAAAADPAGPWPLIAQARASATQKKGDEAVALAEQAVAADGGAPAQAALGFAQEARGDLAAAEAAYRAALAADAGSVSGRIGLARVLRKTGRPAEAEPLLTKALEVAPGAIEAYKESARTKMALRRAGDAIADAAVAAALAENDPEALALQREVMVAKALEYVASKQADLAIQDLTALRDQDPSAVEVRVGLAKAYVAKRQADAALAELRKAVEIKPADAEAQFQIGYVHYALKGNAAAAVGPFQKAVAADPGNPTYRTNLGGALSDTGDYERAIEELTKVTRTGYARADAWIYLGRAYVVATRYREALPVLHRAAELAPNNDQVFASLAWCYFGLKDVENFKKNAGKARALGHKEANLLDRLRRVEAGEAIK